MSSEYHYRPRPIRKKKKKRYFLRIAIVLAIVCSLAYWKYHSYIYTAVDINDSTQVSFLIKNGETVKEVAKNLKDKELIQNETAFYLHVKQKKLGPDIVAGRFFLSKNMNVPEMLTILSNPSQSEAIVTIQEGLTIKDIDQKLAEQGLAESGEFTDAVNNFDNWNEYNFLSYNDHQNLPYKLEGYLYPDTYFVDPFEFEPEFLIDMALKNFESKFADINNNSGYSDFEIITMASIVENEVFGEEDRHKVAGILWKRYESGWTIGADITLLYLKDDRNITYQDLEEDNPYNTRKNLGLPPGPVSNPSIESIEAAVNPTDTEYWFYLTTLDTGEVIYAVTNDEHNINREKYL